MKWFFTLLIIIEMQAAQATSVGCMARVFPSSQLLNVSTSGWASKNEPLVACTIVNPDINRESGLVFLSETTQEDAYLEVRYVDKPFPVRVADNWLDEIPASYHGFLQESLRLPARATDAALVMHSDPSTYVSENWSAYALNRFGVCAYAYPKQGRAWTSVSISTLRQSPGCPWLNMQPILFFER